MTRKMLVALALTLAAAACGSSEQKKQEEAAKQIQQGAEKMAQGAQAAGQAAANSSTQVAQGLAQMAQGLQQMAQGTGKPVDYELLKAALPDVAGWERSNTKGEQVSMGISVSKAETRYRKDDSQVDLEITDTAMSQLALAPFTMFLTTGYSERSDDGFKRAAKVGGQPGYEEWNKDSKHGEVTVVVNNRFIVNAKGRDVADLEPVRKVVLAVDLAKLGALK
jgi:hypothetical protein